MCLVAKCFNKGFSFFLFILDGGVGERDAGHGARGRSSSKPKVIPYIHSRRFHG